MTFKTTVDETGPILTRVEWKSFFHLATSFWVLKTGVCWSWKKCGDSWFLQFPKTPGKKARRIFLGGNFRHQIILIILIWWYEITSYRMHTPPWPKNHPIESRKVIFHPPPWPRLQNLKIFPGFKSQEFPCQRLSRIWPLHRQSITKPRNMRCSARKTGFHGGPRGGTQMSWRFGEGLIFRGSPWFFHGFFLVPAIHFPGCLENHRWLKEKTKSSRHYTPGSTNSSPWKIHHFDGIYQER